MNQIIVAIAMILIFSFVIMMILFFVYFVPTNYHNVVVTNDTNDNLVIIFGALSEHGAILNLPNHEIRPKQSFTYQVSPGVTVYVQGVNSNNSIGVNNPFTTGIITFAGQGYQGKVQITNGKDIIGGLTKNDNAVDLYGVSMQRGYNTPMVIAPYQNFKGNEGFYNCGSVLWAGEITEDRCPPDLRLNQPNYQACMTPCFQDPSSSDKCCTLGCDDCPNNTWITDYTIFHDACPACIITNCEKPNFYCQSSVFLSGYQVNFKI